MEKMNLQDYTKWDGVTNHRNCIYAYQNKGNGKIYVGQTEQFKIRHGKHCQVGENKAPIDKALNKYGPDGFNIYILEDNLADHEAMNEREMYYVALFDSFKNGYNQTTGGCGTSGHPGFWKGKKIPAHVAAHLDRTGKTPWNKGKKMPDEIVAKQRGRVVPEEQRKKISQSLRGNIPWNRGIPMSEEQKAKLSAAKKGNKSKKRVAVLKIDIEGNVIARFERAKQAALIEHTHIHYGKYNEKKQCYYFRESDFDATIVRVAQNHETRLQVAERKIEALERENRELRNKLNMN